MAFFKDIEAVCTAAESRLERGDDTKRLIEIIKRELDNCDHPECIADRKAKGFSDCAGGHLARQVIAKIDAARRGEKG